MGIWLGLTGFPKSLDVSKQIDKMAGAERAPVTNEKVTPANLFEKERHEAVVDSRTRPVGVGSTYWSAVETRQVECVTTAPATEEAQQWQGWGTALKPAHEPIVIARKPLSEKNVAQNVLKHGTGAINVDGCRVAATDKATFPVGQSKATKAAYAQDAYSKSWKSAEDKNPAGRFPPNLLLSRHPDCKPTGEVRRVKAGKPDRFIGAPFGSKNAYAQDKWTQGAKKNVLVPHADPDGTEPQEAWECVEGCLARLLGEPARFYPSFQPEAPFRYVAKASRRERNQGLGEEAGVVNSHPT